MAIDLAVGLPRRVFNLQQRRAVTARLAESTLAEASDPADLRPRAVRCGIVHLGLGAFSRAHLAVYADDLLSLGHDRLGIVGVSLRNDDVPQALGPQDGLYTLVVVDGNGDRPDTPHRIIGSVLEALHAPSQADQVRAALASRDTEIISVTVTEKGYCIDPATRRLDRDHPDVRHDLADPDAAAQRHRPSAARRASIAVPTAPDPSPCSASTTCWTTARRCVARA